MTTRIPPTKLALINSHPRDEFIEFDEGPHIYTVHGEQGYTSVTTFVHSHFGHFDADKIIENMFKGNKMNDPTYKYFGMTKAEIKDSWDKNRIEASTAGTNMHNDIERFYNDIPVENNSIEYNFFLKFVADFPELKPYRTEWTVYYEEFKLSGSIDMIFENSDGTLQIYDWKRCKEIKYDPEFGKMAKTKCIKHLPDTNFWHYSLQLNTYKKILEEKYDKRITDLYLICVHPENPYQTYDRIKVPVLEKEMKDLFEYRKSQLNI